MIAFDSIERTLGCVEDELGRVVSTARILDQHLVCPNILLTYKNPCPIFTIGCTGLAAAASLTIDHTSCFWPATRRAGVNFSAIFEVDETLRRGVEIPVPFKVNRGRVQPPAVE